ncbi:PPOX class F420-dependent oxidoreductase [Streptomyces sp. B6B3]|uniref:PPOX class F420-dependent oxidoreductase n=1 Tax=Streptomyces sp. B6B3 TaxID=3153570 RepID=UPI00325D8F60
MAATLSDELKSYLDDSKPFATVATVSADGRPHLTVVWVKRDGEDLLYSTTDERLQGRNIARDPRVTVMINPAENPYTYAEIRGTATLTPDPEGSLLDELSLKYTGKGYREFNPNGQDDMAHRVIVRITPVKVAGRL